MLFDIAKRHGLHLEEEPSYGGRAYLEKQDYIMLHQREVIAAQRAQAAEQEQLLEAQEDRLEELNLKVSDVESLIDEVSGIAYDKAVEVVTDKVLQESRQEDIRLIRQTQDWIRSPKRKATRKEKDYALARLDGVIAKIQNAMQEALSHIQKKLREPEAKQAGTEQVKKKARSSVLARLKKSQEEAAQREAGRQRAGKKQNMER